MSVLPCNLLGSSAFLHHYCPSKPQRLACRLQKPGRVQSQKPVGGCGGGDGPGRWLWDHIPFRGREARAVLDLTPSDLCVCGLLPTHKGLPEMLPLCLAGSEPRSQGPVSHGQLSGGCKEHVDELQHAGMYSRRIVFLAPEHGAGSLYMRMGEGCCGPM